MDKNTSASQMVRIVNRLGLHARPAGMLVNLTDPFNATVTISRENQVAYTDSVMELMMLTAGPGDQIRINATGPEANAALEAVVRLVQSGFGEEIVSA